MAQIFSSERGTAPQAPAQRKGISRAGPNSKSIEALQRQADDGASGTLQRMPEEEEMLQGKFAGDLAQRRESMDEEEALQGKFAQSPTSQPVQRAGAGEPLPAPLRSNMEAMSGVGLSDVRVHYNSSEPAQLNAEAYAKGTDVHVAPGQEQHVPHEAWHTVQQAQGRVQPTMELGGEAINDDPGLEAEADRMGAKANQG